MQTLTGISITFTASATVDSAKELATFVEKSIDARLKNITDLSDILKLSTLIEAEVRTSFHDNLRIHVYDVEAERVADDKSEVVEFIICDAYYPSLCFH